MSNQENWEEVKKLAADFQRTQSILPLRFSERNCIELIKMLTQLSLIDVIFTQDGKEYVTTEHLVSEIKNELIANGGRISLSDLTDILHVDYSHIEAKAQELSKMPNIYLLLGELITSDYKEHLAYEINEKLRKKGIVHIAELNKKFALPTDFLNRLIIRHIGKKIKAIADTNDTDVYYNEQYLNRYKSMIKGIISAITYPTQLSLIINKYNIPENLFYSVIETLITEKQLNGSFSPGFKFYIPTIYLQNQSHWIETFYKLNGYLTYDSLSSIGINDPKQLLRKQYCNLIFLETLCVGEELINRFKDILDETLKEGKWFNLYDHIPSCFTHSDIQLLVNTHLNKSKDFTIIGEYILSNIFLNNLVKKFHQDLLVRAESALKNGFLTDYYCLNNTKGKIQEESQDNTKHRKKNKKDSLSQKKEAKTKQIVKKKVSRVKMEEEKRLILDIDENYILDKLKHLNRNMLNAIFYHFMELLQEQYEKTCSNIFYQSINKKHDNKNISQLENMMNFIYCNLFLYREAIELFPEENIRLSLRKFLIKTLCTELTNTIIIYLTYEEVEEISSKEVRSKLINTFNDDHKDLLLKLNSSLEESLDDFIINFELIASKINLNLKLIEKEILISFYRKKLLSELSESNDWCIILNCVLLLIFSYKYSTILHMSGRFVPALLDLLKKSVEEDLWNELKLFETIIIKKVKGQTVEETDLPERIKNYGFNLGKNAKATDENTLSSCVL